MLSIRSLTLLATALSAHFALAHPAAQASGTPTSTPAVPTSSTPAAAPSSPPSTGSSDYWFANIDHSKDTVFTGNGSSVPAGYVVFRDVTQYGAKGDGVTDDTAAINQAMATGDRCGGTPPCDSSTIRPAIVYFPSGKYLVSKPITMYYYTQMVGDPNSLPTLLASSGFDGMAVIDADPYEYVDNTAVNWFTNQNNFFRQVRNFVIDISQWGGGLSGAGIHWQVAQATSLQNIIFEQSDNPATTQQGIFMDNGSGGFMADLTFNNGHQCAFLGNQQFTTRNMTFNNCQTAIFMNWNWGWTLQGINVNGGGTALDMSVNPTNQTVGSVLLADSTIKGVQYGVRFAYQNDTSNMYPTGGTLILNNVDMTGVSDAAVVDYSNNTILAPGLIDAWASGNGYTAAKNPTNTQIQGTKQENPIAKPIKAPSLLDSNGNIFTRSRPQYENLTVDSFISAKENGCAGDGTTDDTQAVQSLLQQAASQNKVAYFEHGAYLIKDTVKVPAGTKMTGSIWPLILADSASFNDSSNPKPVFQVGQSGQQGTFEMSDIVFETNGPATGAVMIEWNLNSPQGGAGMWDSHVRIGGSAGTHLEGPTSLGGCRKNPNVTTINTDCEGVFLMFHATKQAGGVYLENTWFWVADHDLDNDTPHQISLYSARGVLIESQGAVWMWGTASEHSIIYNYQFNGAQALFSGFMQSETPYMQPNPEVPAPFSFNSAYDDPIFSVCSNASTAGTPPCKDAWGLRIYNSKNVLIYGTGLYSFFNNYNQQCVKDKNCQQNMIHIQNSQVGAYMVNTANSVNMIMDDNRGTVTGEANRNWFCDTISYYYTDS
jgi:glucan 1,3-beta-glucosidase